MKTIFLFASLLSFLGLGLPVAMALGLSSVLTVLLFEHDMPSLALTFFQTMDLFTLLAIPFFVLAANLLTTGGIARRMIAFAVAAVGHLPGGLAIAAVLACMLFAAVSGSSPATVAAIGSIVIPGMERAGYTQSFATGVIVNAGTLGILIPPSIAMVVFAAATDTSVGRLFMAGVAPGILFGICLMVAIYIAARIKKLPRQPKASWRERLTLLRETMWGLLLIIIVIGGIYGGVFTPTEAAAVAAVYALVAAVVIYGDLRIAEGARGAPRFGADVGDVDVHHRQRLRVRPRADDVENP
jgi:C4-dicarboxylate transporter DctM subunit